MTPDDGPTRKPRADSLRNRELLLTAAKAAFGEKGADVPLDEIAQRAGVGIGTLYRHFPTRAAVLGAVYEREVEQLAKSAIELLASRQAGDALEAWLHLLIDYLAAKRVLAPALVSAGEGSRVHSPALKTVSGVMDQLVVAARASGDIRPEIDVVDVRRMLVGLTHGYDQAGWEPSARRLVAVIVGGLKPAA